MSFTKTKDRVWLAYDVFAAWLARRSMPVRKAGYSVFGGVLWLAYAIPQSKVRETFAALAHHTGAASPRRLFAGYVRGFLRGMNRIEQVRHGRTDAVDAMLSIPDQARLDALLKESGVVLVIPHNHASLAMGRGLSQRYPLLALVRSTANERRAASEWDIYRNLGCEFLDVRVENPATVARKVLRALADKRVVIGTVDRIRTAPPEDAPVEASRDTVRALAFGEAVGIPGWPARFAGRGKAPIIPVASVQTEDTITAVLGNAVVPNGDLVETTQAWVSELEAQFRAYPEEWAFALDKYWSRALRDSMTR